MPKMTRTLFVRVPAGLKAKIDSAARARLMDKSDIVREALLRYFASLDADKQRVEQEVAA